MFIATLFVNTGLMGYADTYFRDAVAYQQTDPRWCDHVWKNKGTSHTISGSGCGICAMINSMYYKTGRFLDPITTADWANAHGYGTENGVGIGFFSAGAKQFGYTYVTEATSISSMLSYIRNGYAACVNVQGHWVAIVDYNSSTNMYLLLDSSVSKNTTTGSGKRTQYILKSSYTKTERNSSNNWTGVAWCQENLFNQSPATGNYGLIGRRMIILKFDETPKGCTCNDTSNNGLYTISDSDGETYVRELENSSSKILATIPNGTIVTVTKCSGNWYYVEEYGGHCYASNLTKYIPSTYEEYIVATESSNLNIRNGKGTSFDIIGKAHKGDVVEVIDKSSNDWYYIKYGDILGYCSAKYLTKKTVPETTAATTVTTTTTSTTTTTTNITTTETETQITETTTIVTKDLTPTLEGDANCDGVVNMGDAVLIMQSLANPDKYTISRLGIVNCDHNNDGVTNLDAVEIQKKLLGL